MTHDNVTDIVEALRRHAFDDCGGFAKIVETHVAYEGAREIISLRKQLENARSEALEEAAKSIENRGSSHDSTAGERYAKVIRALKGQPC